MISIPKVPILEIKTSNNIVLAILREDMNHPFVSGNKLRKLKYNLIKAKEENQTTLLTFGGAYSNHIYATAAAGKEFGFKTIGVIRGEELKTQITENPTLSFAQECGMQLYFVSREDYRKKSEPEFIAQLQQQFGRFYALPEGGTNALAVKGCEEILSEATLKYDYICCPVGTAGTLSGIINSSDSNQKIMGFPALKNADYLQKEIAKFTTKKNYRFVADYHFGGFGKINPELIKFVNDFKQNNQIPLEPLYTGKMMFGIMDLIQKNAFPPSAKILAIHTGGLQGIRGMNQKLKQKNQPQLI